MFFMVLDLFDNEKAEEEERAKTFLVENLDFLIAVLCRCSVMTIKYGFYSKENWNLFRNARLT